MTLTIFHGIDVFPQRESSRHLPMDHLSFALAAQDDQSKATWPSATPAPAGIFCIGQRAVDHQHWWNIQFERSPRGLHIRSRFCFLGALGRPSNNSRCIKTSKQKTAARWFLSQKFFVLTVPRLYGGLFAKQPRFNKTNLQEDGPIFRKSLKRKAALPGEKKAYVASLRIFKHVMW